MSISRRAFIVGGGSLITAASVRGWARTIDDIGRPLLVDPFGAKQTIHVQEGGLLTLGPYDGEYMPPVTWRECLTLEGWDFGDPEQVRRAVEGYGPLDDLISDRQWQMAWEA